MFAVADNMSAETPGLYFFEAKELRVTADKVHGL